MTEHRFGGTQKDISSLLDSITKSQETHVSFKVFLFVGSEYLLQLGHLRKQQELQLKKILLPAIVAAVAATVITIRV